jgi:hypothetical protein
MEGCNEVELLADALSLQERGVVVFAEPERGRLVTHLADVPTGFAGVTAGKLAFERIGNVVRVGSRFVEVPFEEAPIIVWETVFDAGSLSVLSQVLMELLLTLLDECDLLRLSRTNKRMRNVSTEPVLWMHLFARRFGFLPPFCGTGRGFWMSRFAHQAREVASFGSLVDVREKAPLEEQLKRVVLLGPVGGGKSALLAVLNKRGKFETLPSTFVRTTMAWGFVGGRSYAGCKFWDIPGDPRNRSVASGKEMNSSSIPFSRF